MGLKYEPASEPLHISVVVLKLTPPAGAIRHGGALGQGRRLSLAEIRHHAGMR